MEMLDCLNSGRYLTRLIFGGGTMLRLCHGLDRFSVDLDFWADGKLRAAYFADLCNYLAKRYKVRDSKDKFHTLVCELTSPHYPRSLKIEIRKEVKQIAEEQCIAYSRYTNRQILVRAVSLTNMMRSKIQALLSRQEIRDAYDIEFLLKKGVPPEISGKEAGTLTAALNAFSKADYRVKLGSLLEAQQRAYYNRENFKILRAALGGIVPASI